jgi:hypothetical protein
MAILVGVLMANIGLQLHESLDTNVRGSNCSRSTLSGIPLPRFFTISSRVNVGKLNPSHIEEPHCADLTSEPVGG